MRLRHSTGEVPTILDTLLLLVGANVKREM